MADYRPPGRGAAFARLAALGIASTTFALTSCNGTNNTVPPTGGGGSTPTPVPSASVSPGASGAPSATPKASTTPVPTATPTGTPTPVPTGTPTPLPTITPTPGPGLLCSAPSASLGVPYYTTLIATGNVPAGGGALTIDAASSAWVEQTYVSTTPTPTPAPTPTPTVTPVPTPTPTPAPTRPFYVYQGSYHINSATAPTDGCFLALTTTDGSNIQNATYDAEAFGTVNPPNTPNYSTTLVATGKISAISLTLSPSSPSTAGTIALDDSDAGTITVTSVQTVQLPLSRVRQLLRRR